MKNIYSMSKITRIFVSFLIGSIYLGFFDYLQGRFGTEIYSGSPWSLVKIPIEFGVLTLILSQISKSFITYKSGDWKYFLSLGLLGPLMESILVHMDTFKYAHNDMLGIPYWLPLLWGNGGLVIRRLFNLPQLKWRV